MILVMKMNIAVTQSIFKLGPPDFAWEQIYINLQYDFNEDDDNNDDDDDDNDDEDDYTSNSVNFQARTFRLCMKACLDNTYNMMIMKMTIMFLMIMMIKMIIAVSQSIFKLGPSDFAWKQIWKIYSICC